MQLPAAAEAADRTAVTARERRARRQPHSSLCDVTAPLAIEATGRALPAVPVDVQDGAVILPGGFACPAPATGITTVEMDGGWLVHIEAPASAGGAVTLSVEPPADVEVPADDAALARLAIESRFGLDAGAEAALQRAWTYRRACERLCEPFPEDGGPIVAVRWLTLSYEGRVHVAGVGTLDVPLGADDVAGYATADGRSVRVRRIDAPCGAVEVVVAPKRARIKTSPRAVLLDSPARD